MNKLLKNKNIEIYFVVAILIIVLVSLIFSDTSNVQSAHQIKLILKPCKLNDGIYLEFTDFNLGITPYICGEVFSEYMPLELGYYVTNLGNNETVLVCEYINIATRTFTIKLPNSLDTGEYKFELRAGCRKHVAETNFTILP